MRYHTEDLSERAADVAEREADKRWKELFPNRSYESVWLEIYERILREFAYQP